MTLYTLNGSYPAPIPFRIFLSDRRARTDPATFTEAEIADAGYVAVSDPPAHDPAIKSLGWDGTKWTLTDIPPAPYRIAKADIWRRASEEEVDILNTLLSTSEIRMQRIYDGATYVSSDDDLFPMLEAALISAIGQARTDAILAPSEGI